MPDSRQCADENVVFQSTRSSFPPHRVARALLRGTDFCELGDTARAGNETLSAGENAYESASHQFRLFGRSADPAKIHL